MVTLKSKKRAISIFTDEQLQNCVNSSVSVQLYVGEELDYEGSIVGYTDHSITTERGFYLRANCKVETKDNYLKLLTY
jgi:hypothetical protein